MNKRSFFYKKKKLLWSLSTEWAYTYLLWQMILISEVIQVDISHFKENRDSRANIGAKSVMSKKHVLMALNIQMDMPIFIFILINVFLNNNSCLVHLIFLLPVSTVVYDKSSNFKSISLIWMQISTSHFGQIYTLTMILKNAN